LEGWRRARWSRYDQRMTNPMKALLALLTLAMMTGAASAQLMMECATASQRKASVDELTRDIDWFLSIVEEVPAGVAQQFDAVKITDERAFRNAISHPLWQANKIRNEAADIKRSLALTLTQTPDSPIKRAIMALGSSVSLVEELSAYADKNPGRRIVDLQRWSYNYTVLVGQLQAFALCLVDNRQ
jgi:hypothetical protein